MTEMGAGAAPACAGATSACAGQALPRRGGRGGGGEIPAASAGMTEMSAGTTEVGAGMAEQGWVSLMRLLVGVWLLLRR